nr:MAG TPA: hypothetical protein [Caudoviricetes sp.]
MSIAFLNFPLKFKIFDCFVLFAKSSHLSII